MGGLSLSHVLYIFQTDVESEKKKKQKDFVITVFSDFCFETKKKFGKIFD